MTRRIAYLRVSTAEQRPDRQILGLRNMADELHVETLSAVARRRPIYDKVLGRLRSGDVLVVWALDRAYRSVRDAANQLHALQERGVRIHIASMQLDMDTAYGRWQYNTLSANAEYERDNLIERTKEGMEAARARGKHLGRPPKLTPVQLFDAHYRIETKQATRVEIAAEHGIAPWTLTRALKRSVEGPAH